ncbi:hypothetical protein QBC45DRAFT_393142 [Copromyces sp. CBS 386.78]|nr:hypothetical protein QBC45DRAFT_393142 [Copromyces sp. CBS 386.78]
MASAQELVDAYTWFTITVEAPEWYICPIEVYMTKLGNEADFEQACTPLDFAPGLADILTSPAPPTIQFFRSLPLVDYDDNAGCDYDRGDWSHHVQRAVVNGYAVTHAGLLCWACQMRHGLAPTQLWVSTSPSTW